MTYDVLLIDELEGESALLHRVWGGEDVRIVVATSLDNLRRILTGKQLANTPPTPYNFRAALVDLDLGDESEGPAGGLVAVHELLEWREATEIETPIILRTGDLDDGRSMAAVLAAELLGGPLPWWGKSSAEARETLDYLTALGTDPRARPTTYGAKLIQRVQVRLGEGGIVRHLGQVLYEGSRGEVWKKMLEDGPEAAHVYGGFQDRNKFWEPHLKDVILAINFLRDNDEPLHLLEGRDLRPGTIEVELMETATKQIDRAVEALTSETVALSTNSKLKKALSALEARKAWLREWLDTGEGRQPSQHRNLENGEFLGAYGPVICNSVVADLMSARYVPKG